ncbi:MAG: efflux transporter outer membrane subunit [Alphaproteobacteria bacterium]|nr:efflux transporter outer membrane subunit [Alphaproteobacteria bacterium]MDE2041752.1 efflux transporter outer membrane subunit [Alphaproteobacteria bacterium]MDE2339481.1 efflux transporter outer membrane subunit [Alphaproteobacteria bacterium]
MSHSFNIRGLGGVFMLALAGCAQVPRYAAPIVQTPTTYKEAGPWIMAQPDDSAARGKWWAIFGDPQLDALETRLNKDNPSLAAADARYAQALAVAGQARSGLLPAITVNADASRNRLAAGHPLGQGNSLTYTERDIGTAFGYEVDLWGRVHANLAAARADAQASAGDVAAARLLLQAQLATIYFALRGDDEALALYARTVDSYARAYALTQTRHEGGIASGIDVNRAQTQLATAKAQRDAVFADRAVLEHTLAVLTGVPPSALTLSPVKYIAGLPDVPVSAPSTLLQRRPDIAAAERRVYAANARIGVARAALFPQVTLGGSAGFQTVSGALLTAPNTFWALGPASALATLFDNGKRRAAIAQARAQFDEASANYRETVLGAFRDVEDALARLRWLAAQTQDQSEAVRGANATLDLALFRYRSGAADYIEVTTAQTDSLNAERALVTLHVQQAQARVDLVRALGGGL